MTTRWGRVPRPGRMARGDSNGVERELKRGAVSRRSCWLTNLCLFFVSKKTIFSIMNFEFHLLEGEGDGWGSSERWGRGPTCGGRWEDDHKNAAGVGG